MIIEYALRLVKGFNKKPCFSYLNKSIRTLPYFWGSMDKKQKMDLDWLEKS